MRACCYRFSSCTTCPECGGRISRARPSGPSDEAIDRALRRRPDGRSPDPAFAESLQDDYYDGRET